MAFRTFHLPINKESLRLIKPDPYLRKANSFTPCSAGERAEGGGVVECARRRATKRNPVNDNGPVRTKTRHQRTDAKTILGHF